MAGGINNPLLASEVANAGGVGSFGFAYSTPQRIDEDMTLTRELTRGSINANFFIFKPIDYLNDDMVKQAISGLKKLPICRNNVSISVPQSPYYPNLNDQLEPIWRHRPDILTFHFGIPSHDIIEKAHSLDIAVGVTATNLQEAKLIEQSNIDFIVAQGIEAGGHRGVFDVDNHDERLGVMELTKKLVAECQIPIVAAGGIMNGNDIRKVLKVGATAAQLGTAFLCCTESSATQSHKDMLLTQKERRTVFTAAFSGRYARGIENEFIRHMEDEVILPFPVQNTLTSSLRQAATLANNGEYQSMWTGESYAEVRQVSARELMLELEAERLSTDNDKV